MHTLLDGGCSWLKRMAVIQAYYGADRTSLAVKDAQFFARSTARQC